MGTKRKVKSIPRLLDVRREELVEEWDLVIAKPVALANAIEATEQLISDLQARLNAMRDDVRRGVK